MSVISPGGPRRGCCFLLSMLQYILQLALSRSTFRLSPGDRKLLSDFPKDPDTAIKHFQLDGKSVIYAVCPNGKCHQTYKPTFEDGSPIPIYPKYCTHKEYSNGAHCRELLTRPRRIKDVDIDVPIKTFVSFDFKDWFAGVLSRPGYKDRMDNAWQAKASEDRVMHDIFDSEYVQNFKGPDGRFFSLGGEEGRYLFSLSVDFFNPYTNKQSGKKSSVGLISVVCLNLPPSMRYKPENMFLSGVIPGPKEPPLTALNPYLKPLINDLIDFWENGVKFSRTYNWKAGQLVCCALLLLVCDLPGARKLLVLRLLPMNTSVPSAIAHIYNMVMAIWIITRGEVEQILNAVHLPAVLKLLKMREQGLSCSSNLVCAVWSCCASPISMLFSALW